MSDIMRGWQQVPSTSVSRPSIWVRVIRVGGQPRVQAQTTGGRWLTEDVARELGLTAEDFGAMASVVEPYIGDTFTRAHLLPDGGRQYGGGLSVPPPVGQS